MAYTLNSNTPTAGFISWTGASIIYDGTTYAITDGNTGYKYVYWVYGESKFQSTPTYPTLGANDCIVFINSGGIGISVLDSSIVYGGLIVPGTITAEAIAAGSITTEKIAAGAITADKIEAYSITAENIKVNSIDADRIVANTITSDQILANSILAESINVDNLFAQTIGVTGSIGVGLNPKAITLTSGTGVYMDGTGVFRVGSTERYLKWDGTNLSLRGNLESLNTGATFSGNLLSGKSFTGSYTGAVPGDGEKIIGGTHITFGSGSQGSGAEGDYVEVDLGAIYRIATSRIYFYSGDIRSYWYKIKYSEDNTNWYYAVGSTATTSWVKSQPPATATNGYVNPTMDYFTPPIAARYLRLYVDGNTINTANHIYEWEVFSTLPADLETSKIYAIAGYVGGWTINSGSISATNITLTPGAANTANITVGTGANSAGLNSAGASGDIAIWAGKAFADRATAPYRVTAGGAITATSGTVGGWSLSSSQIYSSNLYITASTSVSGIAYTFTAASKRIQAGSGTPFAGLVVGSKIVFSGGSLNNKTVTVATWTSNTDINVVETVTAETSVTYTVTFPDRITIGSSGVFNNSNTSFYVDGLGNLSLKDKLTWDGTTLNIIGNLTSTTGTIGGWTIGSNTLSSSNGIVLASTTSSASISFTFVASANANTSTITAGSGTPFTGFTAGTRIKFTGSDANAGKIFTVYTAGTSAITVVETNAYMTSESSKSYVITAVTNNKIYIGTGTYGDSNTAFYVDGGGYFSLEDKLTWNPVQNALSVSGVISASSGVIGSGASTKWNIGTDGTNASIYSGTKVGINTAKTGIYIGTDGIGLSSADEASKIYLTASKLTLGTSASAITATTGTGFYAGNDGIFRVGDPTKQNLYWNNSTLAIYTYITDTQVKVFETTATGATIGGWSISGSSLSSTALDIVSGTYPSIRFYDQANGTDFITLGRRLYDGSWHDDYNGAIFRYNGENWLQMYSSGDGATRVAQIAGWNFNASALSSSNLSGTADGTDYTTAGVTINSGGFIASPKFLLKSDGSAYFKGTLGAGIVTANSILVKSKGKEINPDPNIEDQTAWTTSSGTITFGTDTTAPAGINYVTNNSAVAYLDSSSYFPVDISKKYRVRFWAKRSTDANGTLYFCLWQYKANFTTCATNGGRSPYKPDGVTPSTTWTEYSSEWTSADFQTDVKYVKLDWLLNYGGTAGKVYIQGVRFEEEIPGELIVDGAISANKISAGAITTDKLSVGAVGGWTVDSSAIYVGTKVTSAGFATNVGDLTISPTVGISSKNFYIDVSGNAKFKGELVAPSGTIGGWAIGTNKISSTNLNLISGSSTASIAYTFTSATKRILAGSGTPFAGLVAGNKFVLSGGSNNNKTFTISTWTSNVDINVVETVTDETNVIYTITYPDRIVIGATGTFNDNNTAFYVDGLGNFSIKNRLTWDGSTLIVNGNVTSSSGSIGGWTIGSTSLSASAIYLVSATAKSGSSYTFTASNKTIVGTGTPFAGLVVGTKITFSGGTLNNRTVTIATWTSNTTIIVNETIVNETAVPYIIAFPDKITLGVNGVYNNSNTAFYVDGLGNFSLKDKLTWDGSTLSINGTIFSTAGTIGGWVLGATTFASGNGITLASTTSSASINFTFVANANPNASTITAASGTPFTGFVAGTKIKFTGSDANAGKIFTVYTAGTTAITVVEKNDYMTSETTKPYVITAIANNKIFIGTGTYNNTNTPFYVDAGGFFSLEDKLTWDPVLNALSISGSITSTSGTIAGWTIGSNTIEKIGTGELVAGALGGIRISNTSSAGNFYDGTGKLKGFSVFTNQSGAAETIVLGQMMATGSTLKTGYYGIQMMNSSGTEYFALGANTEVSGGIYNKIAGWSFDSTKIYKDKLSLNSATNTSNIIVGDATAYDTGNGIWLGQTDASTYKMSIIKDNAKLLWTGSALEIYANINSASTKIFESTASGATIGGWTLSSSALYNTNINISSATASATSGDIVLSGGDAKVYVGSTITLNGSSTGSILVGSATTVDAGAGVFMDGGGNFRAGTATTGTEFIKATSTDVTIKTANFALQTSSTGSIGLTATSYSVGNGVWLSSTANTRFRVGNANASRMQWDDTNLEIYNSSNAKVGSFGETNTIAGWSITDTTISSSGGINLVSSATAANNKIYIGTGTYGNANTSFLVDGSGRFSLKDKLTWDGTTLTVTGGGTFSGALSGGTISIGADNNIFKADSNGIYLGNATFADAPFNVTPAGALTAKSGSIGGWSIHNYGLSSSLDSKFFTGGYNESGDIAEGEFGFYLSGDGAVMGVSALFNSLQANTIKTKIAGKGSWIYSTTWASSVAVVTNTYQNDYDSKAVILSDGTVVCVFCRTDGAESGIWETTRNPTTGTWGTAVKKSTMNSPYVINLLTLPDDRVLIMLTFNLAPSTVYEIIRDINGIWSTPKVISFGTTTINGRLRGQLQSDGNVFFIYYDSQGGKSYERIRYTDSTWSTPVEIPGGQNGAGTDFIISSDGSMLAAVEVYPNIKFKNRSSAGVWDSSYYTPPFGDVAAYNPQFLWLPDSTLALFYMLRSDYTIRYRVRATNGTWGSEVNTGTAIYIPTINPMILNSGAIFIISASNSSLYSFYSYTNSSAYSSIPGPNETLTVDGGSGIVEIGENSNGSYAKFGDGTMICWYAETLTDVAINSAYGSLYQGTKSFTFPSAFAYAPTVVCGIGKWGSSASWQTQAAVASTTGVTLRFMDVSSRASGTATDVSWMVIGRWK